MTHYRPGIKARNWAWKDREQNETPGIALWGRAGLVAHLSYEEAVTLSNRLIDLVDAAGNPEEPLPTTYAESE